MFLALLLLACAKAAPPEILGDAPHPCAELIEEANGRVVGRTDYVLDDRGRVTATEIRVAGRLASGSTTTWSPERSVERGTLHTASGNSIAFTVTQDLDAQGRVVRITRDGGTGRPMVVTQTWEGEHLARTENDRDGGPEPETWEVYTYAPDVVEVRTHFASEPDTVALTRRTLEHGRTVLEAYDHGAGSALEGTSHFVYDARGRLMEHRVEDGTGAPLSTYRYLYDCPPAADR